MRLKSEFARRLFRLYSVIGRTIYLDGSGCAEKNGGLFPALFSVLSYLWSHSFKIYK